MSQREWARSMQIDGRRGDVDVPEQNLHHARLDTLLQQPRCVAVAETVWADRTLYAGGPARRNVRHSAFLLTRPVPRRSV